MNTRLNARLNAPVAILAALGIAAANLLLTAPAAAAETQAMQLESACGQHWFDCTSAEPAKRIGHGHHGPVDQQHASNDARGAKATSPRRALPPTLPLACPMLDGMPACGL